MRHKHYDLIIAWANGAEIQYKPAPNARWDDYNGTESPTWNINYEYRIKDGAIDAKEFKE